MRKMKVSWDSLPSTYSFLSSSTTWSRSASEARRKAGVAGLSADPPMNGVSASSASRASQCRGYAPPLPANRRPPSLERIAGARHGGSVGVRAVRGLQREVAGRHVARAEAPQQRLFDGAALLRVLAPGAEPAAGGRVDRARQLALDGDLPLRPFGRRLGRRDGGDQAGRVRVRGPLVDVLRGAELDHLAQVHDADPLGHVLDHGEVV